MGGCLTTSEEYIKGKRTDIVAENIIQGQYNVIVDNRKTVDPRVPVGISGGRQPTETVNIQANNIVSGKYNRIVQGGGNDSVCNKSNSTATNGPSNFMKKTDDKDLIRNNLLVSRAWPSVGIIKGPFSSGTGFRVGTKYLATARHVVVKNTAATNGEIDIVKIRSSRFFVEFEYICDNQQHKETNIFYFRNVSYESTNLDTIMLELTEEVGKTFPPPISLISDVNTNSSVYLIGHPNGLPGMLDPKIPFYEYNKDEVDKSKSWAASKGITAEDYIGIENNDKVLFHCASQHGASGALGVMIDQSFDEPQSVLMLLRGFPEFYYGKESFTDSDKEEFLIVEQGVLLSSVYKDMERQPKYNDIVKDILGTLQNPKED